MADTLSKKLSKLFLSSGIGNSSEVPKDHPSVSGYQKTRTDNTFTTTSTIPKKSPRKLHKATSVVFPGFFSSVSDGIRWSTSLLHSNRDASSPSSPDTPGLETPKKQKSRSGRLSATWSRSTSRSRRASKGHLAAVHAGDMDLSPRSDVAHMAEKGPFESGPALDVNIPTPSLLHSVSEVVFDYAGKKLQSTPKKIIGPKLLWPDAIRGQSEAGNKESFYSDELGPAAKFNDCPVPSPSESHVRLQHDGSPCKKVAGQDDDRASLPSYKHPVKPQTVNNDANKATSFKDLQKSDRSESCSPPSMGSRAAWNSVRAERKRAYVGIPTYDDDTQSDILYDSGLKLRNSLAEASPLSQSRLSPKTEDSKDAKPQGAFHFDVEAINRKLGMTLDKDTLEGDIPPAAESNGENANLKARGTILDEPESPRKRILRHPLSAGKSSFIPLMQQTSRHKSLGATEVKPETRGKKLLLSPLADRRQSFLPCLDLPKPALDDPYQAGLYAASIQVPLRPERVSSPASSCAGMTCASPSSGRPTHHDLFELSEPKLRVLQLVESLVEYSSPSEPSQAHDYDADCEPKLAANLKSGQQDANDKEDANEKATILSNDLICEPAVDSESKLEASSENEQQDSTGEEDSNEKLALLLNDPASDHVSCGPLSMHNIEQQTREFAASVPDSAAEGSQEERKVLAEMVSNHDSNALKSGLGLQIQAISQPSHSRSSCLTSPKHTPSPKAGLSQLPSPKSQREVRFTSRPEIIPLPNDSSREVSDCSSATSSESSALALRPSEQMAPMLLNANRSTFTLTKMLEERQISAYDRFIAKVQSEGGKENTARACMQLVYRLEEESEREERADADSVYTQSLD